MIKYIKWHAEHKCIDGNMQHPSDSKACKHFKKAYPDFANNSRLYLGLCTDEYNPFGIFGGNNSL